jgi:hypothetical protein
MKSSRRHARDVRAGLPRVRDGVSTEQTSGRTCAQRYQVHVSRLVALRVAIAAGGIRPRDVADVRRDYVELAGLLADAVTQAFAADALGAATPSGVRSWAGEGMTRSLERELALFAASDVCGLATPLTRPNPRWTAASDPPHQGHPLLAPPRPPRHRRTPRQKG